jgi:type I restriction enzyme R subunit
VDALDEDAQIDFKGKAKAFTRTYDFLGSILSKTRPDWEKLSILLNLLIPKLPAPKEEDLARGILELVDMDSYRAEKRAIQALILEDEEGLVGPVPVETGGGRQEPEYDLLSSVITSFNEQFGTQFDDADRLLRRFRDDVAPKVAADTGYQNAVQNTPQTARIEHDRVLARVMLDLLKDDTEAYKQFVQNPSFKRFVSDFVYELTKGVAGRAQAAYD